LQRKANESHREIEQKSQNETLLEKELNRTKAVTDTLRKEVEKKDQEFKNELNDEKVLKERQEIVNNRLKTELEELKKSEANSKKIVEDKMKAIEKEFIEK
jgi:hypothetical protein